MGIQYRVVNRRMERRHCQAVLVAKLQKRGKYLQRRGFVVVLKNNVVIFASADVLLWKDKKTTAVVIGGTTVIWVLFEVLDYHLLTLLSHVMIGVLAILFVWSKAMTFIKKSPPDIPVVEIPEDLAVNVSRALRSDVNRSLHLLREIAMGHDLKKFLGVIAGLWVLSEVGSCCDFLTLIYIAVLMIHTVPILYDKYQDKVDHFAGKAHTEACKHYEVLDQKVLSKIPRGPAKTKKT
ncbi:Reticulon-like protein B2 [Triticum urartu]|uniref:Reticulon-like protein n=2 Tax=Triticum TaxID=4564 RepID=M7YIB4_TRIUA|nr:Reticulon-like protein B2 [Triticum urartu]